jgi:hypothetical protein
MIRMKAMPASFVMNPIEATGGFAERLRREWHAVLTALRGPAAERRRQLRILADTDPAELSEAGQAASRRALRELEEVERREKFKRR